MFLKILLLDYICAEFQVDHSLKLELVHFIHTIDTKYWFLIAALLMIPALLLNLDLLTIIEDEAIRSLVAIEMYYSGDYLVPRLNGSLYFYKPPLYNWFIVVSYAISGVINEWSLRVPTLVFLLVYAGMVYVFTKSFLGHKMALINSFMLITCGRILFWDSMLGLIDICFSLVIYIQMMLVYYGVKKNDNRMIFIYTAFFTAVGFMLKGFPAILFQGITVFVWLLFTKQLKRIFSEESIFGIIVFCVIVGSYYYLYNQSGALSKAMNGLVDQSARRTILHEKHNILAFFKHLLTYPFENVYHFIPWSIMIIYFWNKKIVLDLWKNDFFKFNVVIFLVNILVYWSSVEVYPRYVLMLVPLIFTTFLFLHQKHELYKTVWYKIVIAFFGFLFLVVIFASILLPFYEKTESVNYVIAFSIFIGLSTTLFLWAFYHQSNNRLILMVCTLLVARIGFNWFVLEDRNNNDFANHCRVQALDIGERYKEKDLRIYKSTKIDYTSSWYISKTREQLLSHDEQSNENNIYYVIDTIKHIIPTNFEKIESFDVREYKRKLYIIKRKNKL